MLEGHRFKIVGVLAPAFAGLDDYPRDVWAPYSTYADLRLSPAGEAQRRRNEITVRLRRGVTVAQAERALTPFMARMADLTKTPSALRAELRPNETPNPLSLELLAVLSPVFAAFVLVLRDGLRERVQRHAGARGMRASVRSPSASRSARRARASSGSC